MKKILMMLILALGLSGCFHERLERPAHITQPPLGQRTVPKEQAPSVPQPGTPTAGVPSIIYSEQLSTNNDKTRSWPTVRLFKQAQGQQAVVLVDSLGNIGEYPNSYEFSPDRKKLYANLESKLIEIDIATGVERTVFTPQKQVTNFVFSNDAKKLYVWNQIYASPNDFGYLLHEVDIKTGNAKILASGTVDGKYLFIQSVRTNNTALLMQAMGEASRPWNLDFKTGQLREVPGVDGALFTRYGEQGKYLLAHGQTVDDPCNDFMGVELSTIQVIDAQTGAKISELGQKGMALRIIAVSPDEREAIIATAEPRVNANNCDEDTRAWRHQRVTLSKGSSAAMALTQMQAEMVIVSWYPERIYKTVWSANGAAVFQGPQKIFQLDENDQFIGVVP